jgi:GT2 family glycosyltransferase
VSPALSVVIPTCGRPDCLRRALEGLRQQHLPETDFEVLVVDDGGDPPADPTAVSHADRLKLKVIRKPNGGLASARNAGARAARGELLVFMDDDIEPCADFLRAHLAAHGPDRRVVALGSLPYPADLEITPFLYYLERVRHYDLFLRYPSGDIPMPPLNGNSSVRRAEFQAAGGYDEDFSSYGGEDTEMGWRLLQRGVAFVYAPEARGHHRHLKGFGEMRRDMVSSGRALVEIVRRYPELRDRVNLDLVAGRLSRRSPSRLAKRSAFRLMQNLPPLVQGLELAIRLLEKLGSNKLLYPFYLLAHHYYYGEGVRLELESQDHARPHPDVSLV